MVAAVGSLVGGGQASQVVAPGGSVAARQGGTGDGETRGDRPADGYLQWWAAAHVKTNRHTNILPAASQGGIGT